MKEDTVTTNGCALPLRAAADACCRRTPAGLRGRTVFGAAILVLACLWSATAGPARAADLIVQAEDVIAGGAGVRPGYAFVDPKEEVANWAGINCSPSPGFPNEPGRFAIDTSAFPAGSYRVWVRLARWGGTPDTTPIPGATVEDDRGHSLKLTFPTAGDDPLGTWFRMHPGGMVGAGGNWAWVRLFDAGDLRGQYRLTVTGDPGPAGAGNYKGLWVDAFRFEETSGAAAPPLPEDRSLPGRWEGPSCLTTLSPRPGQLSLAFPAGSESGVRVRRLFSKPVDGSRAAYLALWVQAARRLSTLSLVLEDDRGRRLSSDGCTLADDRPLRPGVWYYLLLPLPEDAATLDRRRLAALELSSPEAMPEASLCVHGPRLVTRDEARSPQGLSPAGAESLRRTLAVRDCRPAPVGADKKVVLWVRGGWGGMCNPAAVRQRIRELYDSGADGIVLTVNPVVDGKEIYFADDFFSRHRLTEADFATSLTDLRAIDWGPLTSSLIRLNVVPANVDWFEPEWGLITEKARLSARIARAGRLAGFMLDVEQYDWNTGIWRYDNRPQKGQKTVQEYQAQARLRGREMGEAMVAEFPGIDVLTTWAGSLGAESGPLLMPFLEGLASVKGCRVYDGCEPAYPYRTLRRFQEAAEKMRAASAKIGTGFGLWVNHAGLPYDARHPEGNYFSPDTLAHALHYALRVSDKYVWLYREEPLTFWPDGTPAGCYDAIKRARLPQEPGWVPEQ